MIERRRARSADPSEALDLLLEAHRAKLAVPTLIVGRPNGEVVAAAGRDPGALAAAILDDQPDVATWRLHVDGHELVIGSYGRLSFEVGEGVRRILGHRDT